MSRLSVYWPEDCASARPGLAPGSVLPFFQQVDDEGGGYLDVVTRARVLFQNRRCRLCGYPVVEPLERDDGLVNSSGREIPGTATLIGFQCHSCDATWSV